MTYSEFFVDFWLPILKKQYFKFRLQNDKKAIFDLEKNVLKNWHFTKDKKKEILKEIRGTK